MNTRFLSRGAVGLTVLILFSLVLSACAPAPTPQTVEVIKTELVEVVKTVEVEKVVEKTVEVIVTPEAPVLPEGGVKTVPLLTTETDPESVAVFQEIIAEFEELNPDVRIDLILTAHGSEEERLITAASVGADLGIIGVHPEYLTEYVAAGWLMPITEVVDEIGRDQFKNGAVLSLDGEDYAIGYAGGTHSTLWYRKDLLEAAGLQPPTTYEELLAAAEKLTQDTNGDGEIDVYGIGLPAGAEGSAQARFISFVLQNCGEYFDTQGNLAFNNPNVLKALNNYLALLKYSPPDSPGWSWYDGITAYTAEKIAMHPYGGRLGYNLYRDKPELREKTGVTFIPAGNDTKAGRGGYDYIAVYGGARYPEVTKEFLKYFFTGDRLARFLLTVPGHLIPPTKELEEVVLSADNEYVKLYQEDIKTLFDSSNYNVLPPVFMGAVNTSSCEFNPVYNIMPWGGEIFGGFLDVKMIENVVVGGMTPEAAWEQAFTEMQAVVDTWKAEHPDWEPMVSP